MCPQSRAREQDPRCVCRLVGRGSLLQKRKGRQNVMQPPQGTLPQWDNTYFKNLGTLISHFSALNHISLPVFGPSVLRRESTKLCMGTNWYSELKVAPIINFSPLHYPVMIQMNNWEFNNVTVTRNVSVPNVSPPTFRHYGMSWARSEVLEGGLYPSNY